MNKLFFVVSILLAASYTSAEQITCTGKINKVGFLPMYAGKVIALETDYRTSVWAGTHGEEKADMVMSLLLSAFMSDKEVSIQWNTLGATTCDQIEQWTAGVKIDRVYVNK